MKRIHKWTLLGLAGTGLVALLLGQFVHGQPGAKSPPRLPNAPAPLEVLFPEQSKGTAVLEVLPAAAPRPGEGAPIFPPMPPAPKSSVPSKDVSGPFRSDPPAGAPSALKPTNDGISLDVQPGKQQPTVSIEWVGPTAIRVNQPLACQIVVRNTSTATVQNVVVRHRLGQGVTCKGCEPAAVQDVGELVWNLGTLAPQQMRRIDLSLVSQIRGVLNCPATVTFTTVAAHQVQVREPQLAVKMSGPDKVIVGENVTLLFALSNPGDGVSEAVKVKLLLPDGLEHPRGKMIEFDVGNLAPKEIKTMQLVCTARGNGVQKCQVVATGEGSLSSNDLAQIEILMPKLDVVMNGPKLRYLDRHAIYVVKVTNPGSAPASNVEVQNFIPTGFKFHQANHGGQFKEATRLVSWTLGELPAGHSKEIAVDLIPVEAGEHRVVAQAKAARGLRSEADARTVVEGLPSLFIEVGHVDDPIEVGAETAYEIRVANLGTKTETNVEVACTLPDQLALVQGGIKCSTTLKYRQEGRELIFEPLARLAPKADVIFRIQVKGLAPGDIRFRTRIRADGLKDPVVREESTRIYNDDAPVRSVPAVQTAPVAPAPKSIAIEPKVAPTPTPVVPLLPLTPAPTPSPVVPAPLPAPISSPVIPAPATIPSVPAAPVLPLPSARVPVAPLPVPETNVPAPVPTPLLPAPLPETSVPLLPPAPLSR